MKTKSLIFVATLTISALFGLNIARANGVDLEQRCDRTNFLTVANCQSYVLGVVQGISIQQHPSICFPRNFDYRQALPIVQAYMNRHPERLNNWQPIVIRMALYDAYPCN